MSRSIGFGRIASAILAAAVVLAVPMTANAQQVWTGSDVTFTKPDFADWTQPEFQDAITPNVVITRQDVQGIYNIAVEGGPEFGCGAFSPVDTEWAFGSAVDWQTLTFQPFAFNAGCSPPAYVGQPAVMHLISEDIYIDVMFTQWSIGTLGGGTGGGGFSYVRAGPPPVVPASSDVGNIVLGGVLALVLAAGAIFVVRRGQRTTA